RRKNNLDEVVRGAKNETERILALSSWASGQWEWYLTDPEQKPMISWSGDQILTPGETGEIGGFCLYFTIVFAQACQSFGIPVRIATINYSVWGGHEVAEVWSREYQKWIMVDPQFDSIYVSKETGEPMSLLELHEIFLQTYYPDGEVVDRDKWTYEERDRRSHSVDPAEIPIRFRTGGAALSGQLDNDYIWWRVTEEAPAPGYNGGYGFFNTAYVRWAPRSNWLTQPYPMPVTHGRTHWGWDGYLAWTDEQTPRTQEHRHFLRKESDIYDRLCTVDYAAESGRDGSIQVHLATETPGFSHFEVISNGGQPVTTRSHAFQWELSTGVNRLEMRSVDVLGNRGPASELTVNYMPA
ncbi:MAG: transglutaminase-like domain-containing protein, partial [Balneolaceae bacterium]